MILSGYIDPKEELSLIDLIFTLPRHSKNSIAWYHRQWIFTNCTSVPLDTKLEFELCSRTAALYPRNYYAWAYRHWILENNKSSLNIIQEEYRSTCAWVATNISDFSGFQYLQQVMKLMTDLQYEQHMQWLDDLIIKYPGHESLWCHRRFCSNQFYCFPAYNTAQHKFVCDIVEGLFESKSLSNNPKDAEDQKQFALKFGLWQLYMVITFTQKKNLMIQLFM